MTERAPLLDGRTAWIAAWAATIAMTVAYGAPLIAIVAMKPVAAELATNRSGAAAAGSFTYIGGAFGGIVAGWLAQRIGIKRIVLFGATMVAAGLALADLLLGRPAGSGTAWGEVEESATLETANIVGCAYLGAIAAALVD